MKLGLLTCCELCDSGLSVDLCRIHIYAACTAVDPGTLTVSRAFLFQRALLTGGILGREGKAV